MSEILPTLYSRTQTGAIQTWIAEVEGNKFRTTYGQIEGKKTTTEWYVAKPTNVGRSNERNGPAQAMFEAWAAWKKRKDQGYHENIKDIDKPVMIECMLAQKYEDRKDEIEFPVYSQPKLDGIRCICTAKGMFSRGGKVFISSPHIRAALERFFDRHPDVILDGELYCDKLNNDFNKICSLVKKSKPTVDDLEESARSIQYYVYDLIDPTMTFSERTEWLNQNLTWCVEIVRVETHRVKTQEKLDELYGKYIQDGYEGQMVRIDDFYEQKRSKYLLKRKEFQDAEYPILEICEGTGNRTGMAGWMILKNTNGETFKSNVKGNRDFLKELLENRYKLVGEQATVQFFQLTPDGVPRFPYVTSIRNYE